MVFSTQKWFRSSIMVIMLIVLWSLFSCSSEKLREPASEPMTAVDLKKIFVAVPSLNKGSAENPISPDKIQLGQMFFAEQALSFDEKTSCIQCHNPSNWGTDQQKHSMALKVTRAAYEKQSKRLPMLNLPLNPTDVFRDTPSILNSDYHMVYFWDGRVTSLDQLSLDHIWGAVSTAQVQKILNKIKSNATYAKLMNQAFPNSQNIQENINFALASYVRSLQSAAPFDRYLNGDVSALTAQQVQGLQTFVQVGCVRCHSGVGLGGSGVKQFFGPSQAGPSTASSISDKGRFLVSQRVQDQFVFKIPSLRNVTKTGPYYHDGSEKKLDQVIQYMAKSQNNVDLSEEEVNNVLAFLESLSGEAFK